MHGNSCYPFRELRKSLETFSSSFPFAFTFSIFTLWTFLTTNSLFKLINNNFHSLYCNPFQIDHQYVEGPFLILPSTLYDQHASPTPIHSKNILNNHSVLLTPPHFNNSAAIWPNPDWCFSAFYFLYFLLSPLLLDNPRIHFFTSTTFLVTKPFSFRSYSEITTTLHLPSWFQPT